MAEIEPSNDWSTKQVFSTGEAAEVCNVSQQTIIRCFDSGRLQGFRVPGSKFRRIPRAELIRFMTSNDIPLARIEGDRRPVLCLTSNGSVLHSLPGVATRGDRLDIAIATNAFDAGWEIRGTRPVLVVCDESVDPDVCLQVVERLGSEPGAAALVAVIGDAALGDTEIALRLSTKIDAAAIESAIVELLDAQEPTRA